LAASNRWPVRELARQIASGTFARVATAPKLSTALREVHPEATDQFKDVYSLEFLGLSPDHSEADLHRALLRNLGRFINELGRDFCFVGSEYERPSIGVLLCASKDNEVVEYALSRSLSPTLVAEYQTALPSKALLRRKLHELYAQLAPE
jgi:hypothetical protein